MTATTVRAAHAAIRLTEIEAKAIRADIRAGRVTSGTENLSTALRLARTEIDDTVAGRARRALLSAELTRILTTSGAARTRRSNGLTTGRGQFIA